MAKSTNALLSAARSQLNVTDESAAEATTTDEQKPAAVAQAPRTRAKKSPAKKAAARKPTAAKKATPAKPAVAKKATPAKPADTGLYDRLMATGDPMRVLYDTGLAARGAAHRVLNVQQPLPLRDALDRWAAAGEGRSRKALINALLAAYLADTGDLEVAES